MPWFLLAVFLTFMSLLLGVQSHMTLPDIHWNSSNPMFKTSNNDHIISVNMYNEINFVCPHYSPGETMESLQEYYIIYSVTKAEYENCNIHDNTVSSRRSMVINCSQPESERVRKYTLIFEPFSAFGGFQFKEGLSYYYITTSTGSRDGMSNLHHGACHHRNMKLTLKVKPLSTTTSTSSTPSTAKSTTTTEASVPGEDTTTTPWWWWETPKPQTQAPVHKSTYKPPYGNRDSEKPPFEDKDSNHNEIEPQKEGLVDSGSLVGPTLVLYAICWLLNSLFHWNTIR